MAKWTRQFSPEFELRMMPVILGRLLDLPNEAAQQMPSLKTLGKLSEYQGIAVDLIEFFPGRLRLALRRAAWCLSVVFTAATSAATKQAVQVNLKRPSVIHDITYARTAIMQGIDEYDLHKAGHDPKPIVEMTPVTIAGYILRAIGGNEGHASTFEKTIRNWADEIKEKRAAKNEAFQGYQVRRILEYGRDHAGKSEYRRGCAIVLDSFLGTSKR